MRNSLRISEGNATFFVLFMVYTVQTHVAFLLLNYLHHIWTLIALM